MGLILGLAAFLCGFYAPALCAPVFCLTLGHLMVLPKQASTFPQKVLDSRLQ